MNSLMHSPAAERNREPIMAVLRRVLPDHGTVLEIASGSGQHAVHFARALPALVWQPTDPDIDSCASISARVSEAALPNLLAPLPLDVLVTPWPVDSADAVVCINMIHISPPATTPALFAGCDRIVRGPGPVVLYGPFRRQGIPLAASNAAFDASLKSRNPEWGLRELEQVSATAARHGFEQVEVCELPANNIAVVYRRSEAINRYGGATSQE